MVFAALRRYDPRDLNVSSFTTKDAPADGEPPAGVRVWQNQDTEVNPRPHPAFMNHHGQWIESKLPGQVVGSQAQKLTATGAPTAAGTLTRSLAVTGDKAIGAVVSYMDCSPAVNTECVHDAAGWAYQTASTWDATVQVSQQR